MQIQQLQSLSPNEAKQLQSLALELGYENEAETLFTRTAQIVKLADHAIFVAKIDDRTVAWVHSFIALRVESPIFVEIAGLVVSADFRKQHLGQQLIEAVKTWSKQQGIHQVKLRCNVIRTESHRFYQKIGFQANKQQTVFEIDI